MAGVAICARNIVTVMLVAVPAEARIGCVAIQAETILQVDRRSGVRAEYGIGRRALLATPHAFCVISRRSVTGFALQLTVTEGSVRVSWVRMWSLENCEDRFFLVARETGICALTAVAGLLAVSGAGGQEQQHHRGDDECNESHSGNPSCFSSVESRVLCA